MHSNQANPHAASPGVGAPAPLPDYPAKMAVCVPSVTVVDGPDHRGAPYEWVFLDAFALLEVQRDGAGFRFNEVRRLDPSGMRGVDLLKQLTARLDESTAVAGIGLDEISRALELVPRDDLLEASCKAALKRLHVALGNPTFDADWFIGDRLEGLTGVSSAYGLPAQWNHRGREANPAKLERQLSAMAQTIWLVLARELLDDDERRRAHADYDQWRTAHSIV